MSRSSSVGKDASNRNKLKGLPLHQAAANRLGLPKIDIDFSRLSKAETGRWLDFSFDDASPSVRKGAIARVRRGIEPNEVTHLNAAIRRSDGYDARISFNNGDHIVCYFVSKTARSAVACYPISEDRLASGDY